MAYVTKYRGEFADIENNVAVAWTPNNSTTGSGWTTFSMTAGVLTGVASGAASGGISPSITIVSGATYKLTLDAYVLNSGATPTVSLNIGAVVSSNSENVATGVIELTATASGTATITVTTAGATNFEVEFISLDSEAWKIEILEDGYVGAVTTMQMAGYPLEISYPSTSDDIHEQNIRGSAVSINVMAETNFAYSELFTSDNFEFKINIYYNYTLFWTGWVTANIWQEPYADVPYPVTISGTDGLGLLKDNMFADFSTSRVTAIKLIYDILSDIGYTTLDEFVNVYDTGMAATTSDSALQQTLIETDLFEDYTEYEVLETILKTFNATIIQKAGIPTIYRYKELQDTTMNGRRFTAATTKSSITNTPLQYFDRTSQSSNFVEDGKGTLMIIPQLKQLNITHNYHSRESILNHWQFLPEEFNETSTPYTVDDWSLSSTNIIQPFRDHGVQFRIGDTSRTTNIQQTVSNIVNTGDLMEFNIDYGILNQQASPLSGNLYMKIQIGASPATGVWWDGSSWSATEAYIDIPITLSPVGFSGWTTYSFYTSPQSGTLRVTLYDGESASGLLFGVYKDIQIRFLTTDYVDVEGKNYTVSNAVNGGIIDLEYDLGDVSEIDNARRQHNGSLMYDAATDALTSAWSTRGGAEADPIVELIGGEIGNQFSRPKHLLDVSLFELNNDSINLVGRFEDVLNQYSAANRKFVIADAMLDVKRRLWRLSLSELI